MIATDITLGIGAEVTATALAGLTVTGYPLQLDSKAGVDADNDGAADFIGTDSFAVVGGTGVDSELASLLAGFGAYVGVGTFDVTLSSAMDSYVSTTGGFGPIDPVAGTTEGYVTVTYEYTPVPEASTALLLTLGLVAVADGRRRIGR